jgi:hypothetical protein
VLLTALLAVVIVLPSWTRTSDIAACATGRSDARRCRNEVLALIERVNFSELRRVCGETVE